MDEQVKREKEIIKNSRDACRLHNNIITPVSEDEIAKINNTDFYKLLKIIECSFSNEPTDTQIHNSFYEIAKIGAISEFSNVWLSNFRNNKNLFILKTPKDLEADNLLYHEFFIGVICLNKLRQWIPNFVYTFGIFRCGEPEMKSLDYSNLLCGYGNKVNYLILENIREGQTWKSVISQNINTEFVLSYIVQLTIALHWALENCDFSHHDLHGANILMKHIAIYRPSYIFMPLTKNKEEGGYYIRTNYIPMIIDFGTSHIKYLDEDFGYLDRYGYNNSSPADDLYKLLGNTLLIIYNSGNDIQYLLKMLLFFPFVKNVIERHGIEKFLKDEEPADLY